MKLLIISIISTAFCFADLEEKEFSFDPDSIERMETSQIKNPYEKNGYVRFGVNGIYGSLGVGFRNKELKSARDHCLSYNYCPYLGSVNGLFSYRYSRLHYSDPSTQKYSGIGFEAGIFCFNEDGPYLAPIPNVQLIFGRELESPIAKWIQTEVNLLPLALIVIDHGQSSKGMYGGIFYAAALLSMVSINIGF